MGVCTLFVTRYIVQTSNVSTVLEFAAFSIYIALALVTLLKWVCRNACSGTADRMCLIANTMTALNV